MNAEWLAYKRRAEAEMLLFDSLSKSDRTRLATCRVPVNLVETHKLSEDWYDFVATVQDAARHYGAFK